MTIRLITYAPHCCHALML